MSQNAMRFCIQCGAQNPLSQPFCSNCGARQDVSGPNIAGNDLSSSQSNPYAEPSGYAAPYQQGAASTQYGGYQQSHQPFAQAGYQQQYQQAPLYTQPQPNSVGNTTGIVAAFLGLFLLREARRRVIGCVFTLIIIVAIIACALIAHH